MYILYPHSGTQMYMLKVTQTHVHTFSRSQDGPTYPHPRHQSHTHPYRDHTHTLSASVSWCYTPPTVAPSCHFTLPHGLPLTHSSPHPGGHTRRPPRSACSETHMALHLPSSPTPHSLSVRLLSSQHAQSPSNPQGPGGSLASRAGLGRSPLHDQAPGGEPPAGWGLEPPQAEAFSILDSSSSQGRQTDRHTDTYTYAPRSAPCPQQPHGN